MKPSQILEAAATVLLIPGAWTRHAFARNEKGKAVAAENKNAICWCALGAIASVYSPFAVAKTIALDRFEKSLNYNVSGWNDEVGQTAEGVAAKMFEVAEELKSAGK